MCCCHFARPPQEKRRRYEPAPEPIEPLTTTDEYSDASAFDFEGILNTMFMPCCARPLRNLSREDSDTMFGDLTDSEEPPKQVVEEASLRYIQAFERADPGPSPRLPKSFNSATKGMIGPIVAIFWSGIGHFK